MSNKELNPEKIKADLLRNQLMLGAGLALTLLLIVVSVNFLLPKEYRACSLMPGFCAPKKDKKARDSFEELGKGKPKFELSSGFSLR